MARSFSGTEARQLLRHARTASLATVDRESGSPYASLVNVATDLAGRPIIFISRLAWHTQNLLKDGRGSVLVTGPLLPSGDALTSARATVMGTWTQVAEAAPLRARYAAHHPAAEGYLDFPDFSFWALEPLAIHAVAGFGRIETMPPREVFLESPDESLYASATAHVNADHPDAAAAYATKLLGAAQGAWRIGGTDPDGVRLTLENTSLRLDFAETALDAGALRLAFAALSKRAAGC